MSTFLFEKTNLDNNKISLFIYNNLEKNLINITSKVKSLKNIYEYNSNNIDLQTFKKRYANFDIFPCKYNFIY